MKRTFYIALIFSIGFIVTLSSRGAVPIVTNVFATQQPNTKLVNIFYDVFDADGDTQFVSVVISTNSGTSFNLAASAFSGDTGPGITTGTAKQIIWNAGTDWNWNYSSNLQFKVSANDLTIPADMSFIPGGTFQMGNNFVDEGEVDELPVRDVYVDSFYMDKYEVSNEKMREVMQWAFNNGKITATVATVANLEGDRQELLNLDGKYSQISFSNNTFVVADGKTNFPCVNVSWYGAQAFCNYKSDMEGLERCISFTNWNCNTAANGYCLPTENEWEKASRGGATGMRFPWSDTNIISHSRANYYSYWDEDSGTKFYSYDKSASKGYHPDYTNGPMPYTSPVGAFAANDYGLHDMAGNVWEWTSDFYHKNPYLHPMINGSFENPQITNATSFNGVTNNWDYNDSSYQTGLMNSNNSIYCPGLPAADGAQFAYLRGVLDEIAQTMNGFVPGAVYQISWSEAARPATGNGNLWVLMDSTSVCPSHIIPADNTWHKNNITFTASSTSHRLRFFNNGSDDNMIFIDNVIINTSEPPMVIDRAVRGGGWADSAVCPRCPDRHGAIPWYSWYCDGFRCRRTKP